MQKPLRAPLAGLVAFTLANVVSSHRNSVIGTRFHQ